MAQLKIKVETTKARRRSDEHGASLIDILIVGCVLSLVFVFAIPQAQAALETRRLDASASKLAGKLMDARMNAIERSRQAWLLIDSPAGTLQVQTSDNTGSTINVGGAEPVSSGISLGSSPTQFVFTSFGRGTAIQTITLTGALTGRTKTVSVSLAGEISVGPMN